MSAQIAVSLPPPFSPPFLLSLTKLTFSFTHPHPPSLPQQILLLAAGISFAIAWFDGSSEEEGLRAFVEPFVILLILILNAAVGVWQESNAENALDALKEMSAETATVRRGGHLIFDLPARELVPGDIVEVHTGDKIPADLRVISLHTAVLRLEQAALTGESVAVSKTTAPCGADNIELQGKECMMFSGTGVASGSCTAIVDKIGMATEIGKIQAQIQEAAEEEDDTPLKKRLDEFGESLAKFILAVCVAVWLINYHHFLSWKTVPGSNYIPDSATIEFSLARCTFYFKVAVALAVAAIPEGLPAVITTCLALGTRKMAKRNAIVRKLPSVETLGCTTVICSDKTGTLTTNQMSAVLLIASGQGTSIVREFQVGGTTYDPDAGQVEGGSAASQENLKCIAEVCALCNDAVLEFKQGHYRAVGQPTEAALLVLAEKLGVPASLASSFDHSSQLAARRELVDQPPSSPRLGDTRDHDVAVTVACDAYAAQYKKIATLEFDRDRKSMSVLVSPLGVTGTKGTTTTKKSTGTAVGSSEGPTRTRSGRLASLLTGNNSARQSTSGPSATNGSNNNNVLFVKGAAECVVERCNRIMLQDGTVVALDIKTRAKVLSSIEKAASHALRMLALAVKPDLPAALASYDGSSEKHPGHKLLINPAGYSNIESDMVFLGLAGLQDPPRPEVAGAIADCTAAGIRVIVITGDNKLTAEAVCRDIGVFESNGNGNGTKSSAIKVDYSSTSMTGAEFNQLSEAQKRRVLSQSTTGLCFSRAEPRHKQDIVRLLKDMGEVVAMTGDGVNDAPALKLADIGIAMGITGTEVAKEASDMVLADDNFATVVAAVEEGRAIYNNMKAFIRYMISSNIGEVASIFLSAALGLPEGLIPVQLLWVNLVTDGPPATALGFNPADPDIMSKPPRRSSDHFLTPWILFRWLLVGMYVGCATVGAFAIWYTQDSFLWGMIDLSEDGHTPVTMHQLRNWESCSGWKGFKASPYTVAGGETVSWGNNPCDYFSAGKIKAQTLSLSVLVAIEMFNAANALSEDNSMLSMPVWKNPWLLLAMAVSFGLHFLILYVPPLAAIFQIVPLSVQEWLLVLALSLPVILIDEVLKFIGRNFVNNKEEDEHYYGQTKKNGTKGNSKGKKKTQ